jgi:hypothetical protein
MDVGDEQPALAQVDIRALRLGFRRTGLLGFGATGQLRSVIDGTTRKDAATQCAQPNGWGSYVALDIARAANRGII